MASKEASGGAPEDVSAATSSEQQKLAIPSDREKNIRERKEGFEYFLVVINYRPGLKFGLGIKNVYKSIFVLKVDENSIVSGLFNPADRIVDVDGEPVHELVRCKTILVKALKERKTASLLIERALTEKTLKAATDEMNEEHTQSVMVAPDVRSIMRKMDARLRKTPSMERCEPGPPVPIVPSAMSKDKNKGGVKAAERRPIVVEDGHKSVMIRMDNEENLNKLKKVAPKPGPPPPPPPAPPPAVHPQQAPDQSSPSSPPPPLVNMIAPAPASTIGPAPAQAPAPAPAPPAPTPSNPNEEACCEPTGPAPKSVGKSREVTGGGKSRETAAKH